MEKTEERGESDGWNKHYCGCLRNRGGRRPDCRARERLEAVSGGT